MVAFVVSFVLEVEECPRVLRVLRHAGGAIVALVLEMPG